MVQTLLLRSCHLCPPSMSNGGGSQCRNSPPSPRRWHVCSRQDLGACAHHSPTGFVPCSQGFRAGQESRKPYRGPKKDWVVEWGRINKNPALTCLLSPNYLLAPGGQALAFLSFLPSCLCLSCFPFSPPRGSGHKERKGELGVSGGRQTFGTDRAVGDEGRWRLLEKEAGPECGAVGSSSSRVPTFLKGPERKYFWLYELYGLCHDYSALPL